MWRVVFVDQAAEDLGSGDPVGGEADDVRVIEGRAQVESDTPAFWPRIPKPVTPVAIGQPAARARG
jgi:hypothetical protein